MGRYRGGGRGSGVIIQIVVYLVIHIVEAIIKAIANRSKTKTNSRPHYYKKRDKHYDDDYEDDDKEVAFFTQNYEILKKNSRGETYRKEESRKKVIQAKPQQTANTALLPEKAPSRWPQRMLLILCYIFGAMLIASAVTQKMAGVERDEIVPTIVCLIPLIIFLSGLLLSIMGILYKIAGDERYRRFAEARDKNVFTYFLDSGVFLCDKHFWIITLAIAGCAAFSATSTSLNMVLAIMALLLLYLIVSTRHNLLNIGFVAQPVAQTAVTIDNTKEELSTICEHLEDEALVADVREIIRYTDLIEEALIKYPNAKNGELVQGYNAQLLNFLNLYNEAEDLRLGNKASLSMMENTRTYAADLVQLMRNMLEKIYEANVETADVNIEVMRRDMRMRGLVDEDK